MSDAGASPADADFFEEVSMTRAEFIAHLLAKVKTGTVVVHVPDEQRQQRIRS